jgi:hypothetical protein
VLFTIIDKKRKRISFGFPDVLFPLYPIAETESRQSIGMAIDFNFPYNAILVSVTAFLVAKLGWK